MICKVFPIKSEVTLSILPSEPIKPFISFPTYISLTEAIWASFWAYTLSAVEELYLIVKTASEAEVVSTSFTESPSLDHLKYFTESPSP